MGDSGCRRSRCCPSPCSPVVARSWRSGTVVAARWSVPRGGVLDLEDPQAAGLEDGPHPIVLPVTTFEHPERGLLVVDSGVDADLAAGGSGPVRGLLRLAVGTLEPIE